MKVKKRIIYLLGLTFVFLSLTYSNCDKPGIIRIADDHVYLPIVGYQQQTPYGCASACVLMKAAGRLLQRRI